MGRLGILLLIVVAGGIILCPVVMAFEPDPLPGDFSFLWNNKHFAVPVVWSLCASGALALLYSFMRR
jgi:hypothetical protein